VASDDDPISVNMILVPGKKNRKQAVGNGHIYEKDLAYAAKHYIDFNNDFMKYSDMKELLENELVGVIVKDLGKLQVFLNGEEDLIHAELMGPRATDREFVKHFYKRGGEEMGQASPSPGNRVSNHQSYKQIFERGGDTSRGGLSNNNGAAIFVLDGRIVPSIDFLRPGDVKSVKVIRNVGAARYGANGANGAVLINTRHM
jgi:general stress protein YciG